jgi:hypothetical protein
MLLAYSQLKDGKDYNTDTQEYNIHIITLFTTIFLIMDMAEARLMSVMSFDIVNDLLSACFV